MRSPIVVIFFIIISTIFNSVAITFQTTEVENINPQFVESMFSSSSQGTTPTSSAAPVQLKDKESSEYRSTTINEQTYLNYQSDKFPIIVNKYILSNVIDKNYKINTICILVECTNVGDKSAKNINIYEIAASDKMEIINCSSPIKTLSVDEMLRYEQKGKFFSSNDILYPSELAENMSRNLLISSYLNNSNIKIRNNCSEKNISEILNRIANDINLYNKTQFQLLFDSYSPSPSRQIRKFLEQSKNNRFQESNLNFLNFLLLRDKYSKYIPACGSIEFQDIFVDETAGIMRTHISNLLPKETLMFKYYLKIFNYGTHRTTTIIRLPENRYPDYRTNFDVTFPSPKIIVDVVLPKQEVSPGDPIYINYVAHLLTSLNESTEYNFMATVENNNHNFDIINNKSILVFKFSNNMTACNSTNITINEPGSHNIPILVIGNSQYLVQDKYIKVEELWSKYILVLTLAFLIFCTLVGGNLRHIETKISYKIFLLILASSEIIFSIRLIKMSNFYIIFVLILFIIILLYWLGFFKSILESDLSKP